MFVGEVLFQTKMKQQKVLFDSNKDFEVLELVKSNDYASSDNDTSKCINWTLDKMEIEKIIQESRPINGSEWHYLFGHYPCLIQGVLLQGPTEFKYSINSGAWFTIDSPDTTLIFGSFKEENNKFFLDSAWSVEEMD